MQSIKSPIYQSKQVKELENLAAERFGISAETMMERAGKAAFDFLARRWPQIQRIAVFCGSGNNGGDGYVIAKLAHERGLKVTVWQVGKEPVQEVARKAKEACEKEKVLVKVFNEEADINHPELVVDAITGTG